MVKVIHPSAIHGEVKAPASKSYMQRAIALSILADDETLIENPSRCDDALAGLNIAASFGCRIYDNGSFISIIPNPEALPQKLFCGESGLAIRLFAPVAALFSHPVELIAEGSLLKRPAGFMTHTLQQFGVKVESNQGFPPIQIQGPISAGKAVLDGSLSSQFLSGLLIALPKAKGNSVLKVENLMSIPYVSMTLQAIEAFGGRVENKDYQEFIISGNQSYKGGTYKIEGDWSGAAGLLVAGAIAGKITVKELQSASLQADVAVLKALQQAGAHIDMANEQITVSKPAELHAFEFDALHCPDLFPVLTALASNCKGISKIYGVHRLVHKESNRGEVLKQEFNKLGINIDIQDDIMLITGGTVKSGKVNAHNDHRMAMALSLAALNAKGPITIDDALCVNKTYPDFYNDLDTLGVKVMS
ncbi:MAG: 3-phosphoshikimate 1-carboxyvinyltransferase [Bacteroidetes bacterium HGW-Bacteroidetes-4]|jgi:3-phosphoshikimate 1-carboxyvinyltransferase|nr:MAG: 3-phosphoshikimate 1-carboxyvinyltransferase [Bacteroidetes bacterium HGW-Bacteroidetes-4]